MGKVIVIEGSDGSGKATQTKLLYEALTAQGKKVKIVSYPCYESDSSALVKMYLEGEFGADPAAVNPYVASSFFAVDRFASFLKDWKEFYESGEDHIVICDRYVTSNMLHQTAKLNSLEEKLAFLDWEYDFEFVRGGLPVPEKVFFLDVKPEVTFRLMKDRENKITHQAFLIKSYENSMILSKKYGWIKIPCCDETDNMKSIEAIHEMIMKQL